MQEEDIKFKITGHVLIKDKHTDEIILDAYNAINAETMSLSIVESLASQTSTGPVKSMVFGNGGASVSGVGTIVYLPPNITGLSATLYNQTYSKIVNNQDPADPNPIENNIVAGHVSGNLFSDMIVSCSLDLGEPAGQNSIDNATSLSDPYVFNEIGLVSYSGLLLCMIVFSPIEKSTNRSFAISYTIRYQMV